MLVTRLVAFALAFIVTAVPLLDAIGKRLDVGLDGRSVLRWAMGSGLRIAVIVTIAWLSCASSRRQSSGSNWRWRGAAGPRSPSI